MMTKRLFQVFDEMNVNDEKNKTATLPCAFTMVEAKSDKRGGLITMGVEPYIVQKIFLGEMQPVLVVMDKKEYYRLEKETIEDDATTLHQLQQENAELRHWKMEAAELLTKIHSYAHKHLEIKLGESTVEFVIERAKERDELKRQNDKLKEQAEGWRPLLEEILRHDKQDVAYMSEELIDKITNFLYGE